MQLTAPKTKHFYNDLRRARTAVLRDAENFSEVIFALERLGAYLSGKSESLYYYEAVLNDLATLSSIPSTSGSGEEFLGLLRIVREARNDALHVGALARHAAQNAIKISLILEDALMSEADKLGSFMVTHPVIAEFWQPLSLIRYEMLANSFSYLPVKKVEGWFLVSDASIVKIVRGTSNSKRKVALALSLEQAVCEHGLQLTKAPILKSTDLVSNVKDEISQKPTLILHPDDATHLIGLITAFDLL